MKKTLASLAVLLAVSACTTVPSASTADTRSKKEIYADELISIVPPAIMFAQLSEPHIHAFGPPHLQAKAHAKFMRQVDPAALDDIVRKALIKHFTEAELKAMADFYTTPEGQRCMSKVAPFVADVFPACMSEATRTYRKAAMDAALDTFFP